MAIVASIFLLILAFREFAHGLAILLSGEASYDDSEAKFVLGKTTRIGGGCALLALILGTVVLFPVLQSIQSDYETSKTEYLNSKRLKDKNEKEQADLKRAKLEEERAETQRKAFEKIQAEINSLKQEKYDEFKNRNNAGSFRESYPNGQTVFNGIRTEVFEGRETEVAEIRVLDEKAQEKLVLVVHLLKDFAYWQFRSRSSFVQDGEESFPLFDQLENSEYLKEFSSYDIVIGLGLSSNTPNKSKSLSYDRARCLNAGLAGLLSSNTGTKVAGLDIGYYLGASSESDKNRDKTLRPVVIAGVNIIDPTLKLDDFLEELLSQVRLAGLDLKHFAYLLDDSPPKWATSAECAPDLDFMHNK